jgi:hypothetical protein
MIKNFLVCPWRIYLNDFGQILVMAVEDIIVGRDPSDLEKYGKRGCINLGKHVVGKGYDFHLTNPVLMDVIRPHVVLVLGKRGGGKSYTAGVIAEEMSSLSEEIRQNLACLMIDTMGIFWSMKNRTTRTYCSSQSGG